MFNPLIKKYKDLNDYKISDIKKLETLEILNILFNKNLKVNEKIINHAWFILNKNKKYTHKDIFYLLKNIEYGKTDFIKKYCNYKLNLIIKTRI